MLTNHVNSPIPPKKRTIKLFKANQLQWIEFGRTSNYQHHSVPLIQHLIVDEIIKDLMQ